MTFLLAYLNVNFNFNICLWFTNMHNFYEYIWKMVYCLLVAVIFRTTYTKDTSLNMNNVLLVRTPPYGFLFSPIVTFPPRTAVTATSVTLFFGINYFIHILILFLTSPHC